MKETNKNQISRRDFVKASAAIGAVAILPGKEKLFAQGSDKLRVGIIGCGWRGTGAAMDCVHSSPNIEILAMADLFSDRLESSLENLNKEIGNNVSVTSETSFTGFDAYEKVIASDIDMVILACPPHFRPKHLAAAVKAGKHVFMEKPVAVDPVGIRSIIASSDLAKEKGLAIVAGTQRRHQNSYREVIKRIHNGDIGEIISGQCYWNDAGWNGPEGKSENESDLEYQIRGWFHFTWLAGDEIVEQHVHNIDVMNWAIGSHPVKALGMGGREVRAGDGNIYDHFAVEFEYPNGQRIMSMCRHMDGCTNNISERVIGTKGLAYTDGSTDIIEGPNAYKYDGESNNPYVTEHTDLIASIRNGQPLNEGRQVAESTLTAIMGRMSAYTGRAISWDWVMNASKLDLSPPEYSFDIEFPVRPIAIPGQTKLI
ncbi:MAG: Gfo/Idh/MocA family oxidoreductase [Planctomycetota bacterium]|jgi:predicted dehydrogenase